MGTYDDYLVQTKAIGMTNDQISAELLRCQEGIRVAATLTARRRFQRRLRIMSDELLSRLPYANTSTPVPPAP